MDITLPKRWAATFPGKQILPNWNRAMTLQKPSQDFTTSLPPSMWLTKKHSKNWLVVYHPAPISSTGWKVFWAGVRIFRQIQYQRNRKREVWPHLPFTMRTQSILWRKRCCCTTTRTWLLMLEGTWDYCLVPVFSTWSHWGLVYGREITDAAIWTNHKNVLTYEFLLIY